MKGRHISNNSLISLVLDFIDYNEHIDSESFIYIYFYKAFDTVSHTFMFCLVLVISLKWPFILYIMGVIVQ